MPQYSWNTAKVGVKHQSINQLIGEDLFLLILTMYKQVVKFLYIFNVEFKVLQIFISSYCIFIMVIDNILYLNCHKVYIYNINIVKIP